MKKICVITDNEHLYEEFQKIIVNPVYGAYQFDFYYSERNKGFFEKYGIGKGFAPINLKEMEDAFYCQYDLFLSLHCKQLFPEYLVNHHRCINVHPGLNPYNRGWFPQVFSILNKKPAGVTIHEMDTELDHGPIICQESIEIHSFDTSWSVYQRILKKEIELLTVRLTDLIEGNYETNDMPSEGNVNSRTDFERLCHIDMGQEATYGEVIDLLRAMTFDTYDNAYFVDSKGNKIYVSVNLKRENSHRGKYLGGGWTPFIVKNIFSLSHAFG